MRIIQGVSPFDHPFAAATHAREWGWGEGVYVF